MQRGIGILALIAVGAAAVTLRQLGGPEAALEAVRGLGPVQGPVALVVLHGLSVACLVPSVVPTLAAGALFGVGLAATLVLTAMLRRLAARALAERDVLGQLLQRMTASPRPRGRTGKAAGS